MIFDRIENLEKFSGAIPYLNKITAFLRGVNVVELEAGRHEVGDGVFVNVQDYEPLENNPMYEAHKKYADLQYVVSGVEMIRRCDVEYCTDGSEFDVENDYCLYKTAKRPTEVVVHAGEFLYLDAHDAHAPGNRYGTDKVKKLIFKIPV